MEFNQLVIERIAPLFKDYDFIVVEQYKNYFRFKSIAVEAIISYNELDRTSLFEIGKADKFLYSLNDKLIRQVFHSDEMIDQVTKEVFVDNVALFLKGSGSALLGGDKSKLSELRNFSENESEIYTLKILQQQNLAAASKAWENGNYKEFIRIIDQIDKDNLPTSYQLRYKIANQKV